MVKNKTQNPVADTGKTTAIDYDEIKVGEDTAYTFDMESDSYEGVIIGLTDACIDITKKGHSAPAYTNMWVDGERVGVSVSFHNVLGEIYYAVTFNEDNKLDDDFKQGCAKCVQWYMRKRGLFNNKSFNNKVMKSNPDFVREVGAFTNYYYQHTSELMY